MTSSLDHIANLDAQNLRVLWQQEFDCEPAPRLGKDLMIRLLSFKVQEKQSKGLSKQSLRKLQSYKKQFTEKGKIAPTDGIRIKPGTKLIREWNGKTHTVLKTEQGFEYEGKCFSSLSNIAKQITGSHWSGPRFFGLNKKPTPPGVSSHA